MLCEPHDPSCNSGVIFFNNVGYLGMCGHGTIGVVATLAHLGRIGVGTVRIDTPVGPVACELHRDGSVSVENVESYRKHAGLVVDVPGLGEVSGDVAYGGNWFFITEAHGQFLEISRIPALTECGKRQRAHHHPGHHKFPRPEHQLKRHARLAGPSEKAEHYHRVGPGIKRLG
jgi:4-hydroxyproline epimerase